jgi:hypothetical protein
MHRRLSDNLRITDSGTRRRESAAMDCSALSSGQSCEMQRDQLFEIFFQIGELLIAAGVTPDEQRIMHCL